MSMGNGNQAFLCCRISADAKPYNWDRSKSLELILMSLPQLGLPNHTRRFPITALPIRTASLKARDSKTSGNLSLLQQVFVIGENASTQIMTVKRWMAGEQIAHRCVLAEVRADWKWLSEVLEKHWNLRAMLGHSEYRPRGLPQPAAPRRQANLRNFSLPIL